MLGGATDVGNQRDWGPCRMQRGNYTSDEFEEAYHSFRFREESEKSKFHHHYSILAAVCPTILHGSTVTSPPSEKRNDSHYHKSEYADSTLQISQATTNVIDHRLTCVQLCIARNARITTGTMYQAMSRTLTYAFVDNLVPDL
jgi:hypothetical protein